MNKENSKNQNIFTVKKVRKIVTLKNIQNSQSKGLFAFASLQKGLSFENLFNKFFNTVKFASVFVLLVTLILPVYKASAEPTSNVQVNVTLNFTHGGNKLITDFPTTVYSNSVSVGTVVETGSIAVEAGTFSVQIASVNGYSAGFSGCSGSIDVEETKVCNIEVTDNGTMIGVLTTVDNTLGGTKTPGDFTISISGTNPTVTSMPGTDSFYDGIFFIDAGAFNIDGSTDPDYTKTLTGCSGTIVVGTPINCFITYTFKPAVVAPTTGTLTVFNNVVNDNGNIFTAPDFTALVTSSGSPASASTSESGVNFVINPGNYQVNITGPVGYSSTFSTGCSGVMLPGESNTCTITTDDVHGLLLIKNTVIGSTKTAGDFTVHITGTNVSLNNFSASEDFQSVYLDPGTFTIDETDSLGYTKTLGLGCSGSIAFAQVIECEITNTWVVDNKEVVVNNFSSNSGSGSTGGSSGSNNSGGNGIVESSSSITPVLVTLNTSVNNGQILGASTQALPRTGTPIWFTLSVLGLALFALNRKLRFI